MAENEPSNKSGDSAKTHDDVCCLICVALEKYQERKLGPLLDYRCKKAVLTLFEKANQHAKGNACTLVHEYMKKTYVKTFFTGGANELREVKLYKVEEPEDFTEGLVYYVIKRSSVSVSVIYFINDQAKSGFYSDAKSRQDKSPEIPDIEEVKISSRITGRSPEPSKTFKDDREDIKENKTSSDHHEKFSSFSKYASSRYSGGYDVNRD